MSAFADWLIPLLFRGSLTMLLAMLIVRLLRPRSLVFRRMACVVVLLHGWLLVPLTVEIPWYDPPLPSNDSLEPMRASTAPLLQSPSTVVSTSGLNLEWAMDGSVDSFDGLQRLRMALCIAWVIGVIVIVLAHGNRYRQLCQEDRFSFLRALGKRVVKQNPKTFLAGHNAHAHPLLLRMRRLTEGPLNEESKMTKSVVSALLIGLLLVQTVRPELVAKEPAPPMSVKAVENRVRELDRKLDSLEKIEESMQEHAAKLRETVDAKAASLEELRNAPEQLSAAAHQRVSLFLSGDEAEQMQSLDGIADHDPRDEAVLLCGHVAAKSIFVKVRQAALRAACSFGKTGYAAIALAYEDLDTADRIFLLEQMRQFEPEDRVVLMALMAEDANKELLAKLIEEPFADDRRLVLLGKLAEAFGDEVIAKILQAAESTAGEQGILMLYAAAKTDKPLYVMQAVKAARKRGPVAYPVIAIAGKCQDPTVRAEIVGAAKAWGGEVGTHIIDRALHESDESLRQAAEQSLDD